MKKIISKNIGLLFIVIASISLGIYFYNLHKNTYLSCTSFKETKFYMKIDRPYFAYIFISPAFIKDNWYTRFNEIYTTEFDIVIRDKDKQLGDQFFYESMSLDRVNLNLSSAGFGKIGSCTKIKKEKRKI